MAQKSFVCDYLESAHPKILQKLIDTNFKKDGVYGGDSFSAEATKKIRGLCNAPKAEVFYLVGGTQTNMVVISYLLRPFEGVVAAKTGHVAVHEAGAIEGSGHKVIELPQKDGKITAEQIEQTFLAWKNDDNREHMVKPGMVYITQPTEYGTLYSLEELEAISAAAHKHGALLYLDGARLLYGLAAKGNDVTLEDIARLTDVFYIGGTKAGLLFGEAVVFPRGCPIPGFFTYIKHKGALLAKGKVAGVMFDTLFTDGLWKEIGAHADEAADKIRTALRKAGYRIVYPNTTNQIFLKLTAAQEESLSKFVKMDFFDGCQDGTKILRIATSWATPENETEELCKEIESTKA